MIFYEDKIIIKIRRRKIYLCQGLNLYNYPTVEIKRTLNASDIKFDYISFNSTVGLWGYD